MSEAPARVVAVVRHRGRVLTCEDPAGGRSLPAQEVGAGGPGAALDDLLGRLELGDAAVEREGPPVDADGGRLVPFLVAATARTASVDDGCPAPDWDSPTALLDQPDDRWLAAYRAVAPTVETVAGDAERGSAAIAVDALWTLRDAAAEAASRDDGLGPVADVAEALLDARPSMAALVNRVNRAMADARTPADVEAAADAGLRDAREADAAAAELAAETVDGGRVLTLSRSGTVREALLAARPAVVVLASLPGGEGRAVADELDRAGLAVERCPDAAVYARLRDGDVDAVLVGADAVTTDGGVVNKVGTRAAALAAERAGVPCYAVCASDKVRPADGDATPPLEPRFDLTPPELVTAVLTERGRLAPEDVREVADEHRALTAWRV